MRVEKAEFGYHVILQQGEDIGASFVQLARDHRPPSGHVVGVGSVRDLVLGFYDVLVDALVEKRFPHDMELTSFVGNLSYLADEPVLHAHVTASDREFRVVGGHFLGGTINVTGEFALILDRVRLVREKPEGKQFSLLRMLRGR